MSYGKSPAQIAAELGDGYEPEWVYSVCREILGGFDAYTIEQQLKIGLNDLQVIAATAKELYLERGDPRQAKSAVEALTAITDKLQATLDRVDNELFALDSKQVGLLVSLVQSVVFTTLDEVFRRHPELEAERGEYEAIVVEAIEAASEAEG